METLRSFVNNEWVAGNANFETLVNPSTEEPLARASSDGIDLGRALSHLRTKGGPALRGLTFAERGELLLSMSRAIHAHRDELIEIGIRNAGNTRGDAKFDIDGASGTLAYYAELGKSLGSAKVLADGDGIQLGRGPRFFGQHVLVPRFGAAVHINAFNFPAWGLAEKAAAALLSGMPVLSKPATSTAMLAVRVVELVLPLLPEGALSLVVGQPQDLLEHLDFRDVIAFTGSSQTAAKIRQHRAVVEHRVRLNVEADSLNSAILGPDVSPGSDTWSLFMKDVARDIVQKAGQKCTAIRRVLVPKERLAEVRDELVTRLRDVVVGNPEDEQVTMGPLATEAQLHSVQKGIAMLAQESTQVLGRDAFDRKGVAEGKGYFVPPTLFVQEDSARAKLVHEHEVFGPASTVLAYTNHADTAVQELARGGGGLVCSIYSDDRTFVSDSVFGAAACSGRVFLGSEKLLDQTAGPGTVLPHMIHGGPGRAGGGEELGGLRGLALYSQRCAIQGSRPVLENLLGTKKEG